MATYTMTPAAIAEQARLLKTVRWWMTGVSVIGLALSLSLIFVPAGGLASHIPQELQRTILVASFVILVQTLSPWKMGLKSQGDILKQLHVEITSDDIEVRAGLFNRSLRRDEIVRAEESSLGRGLFLRTSNWYRWILIPRRIDGYQEIKDNLTASGTIVVSTKILPNWEEFFFVFLFCASLMCDIATHNRSILLVNLAAAVLIGVFGMILAKNLRDSPKFMLRVRLGSMIPAFIALLAVLYPFGMF